MLIHQALGACFVAALSPSANAWALSNGTYSPDVDATRAAVDAMMTFYDNSTGRWDLPSAAWWQSAIALQDVLDFMDRTGSQEYMDAVLYTVQEQRKPIEWWPQGHGEFRADSTDDTAWWALAMTKLYQMTNEDEYLNIAKLAEDYIWGYWSHECGGGVIWNIEDLTYHSAISNELFIELAATLHNLIPGDTHYLDHAQTAWDWFNNTGLINSEGLINDGLLEPSGTDGTCANNNGITWSYNQGVILGALAQMAAATGDSSYLDRAKSLADSALASRDLFDSDGILTEPCGDGPCEGDAWSFKGIFMRYLGSLDRILDDRPYRDVIRRNAAEAYTNARMVEVVEPVGSSTTESHDFYGGTWQGPWDEKSIARQESAVGLLVAAMDV